MIGAALMTIGRIDWLWLAIGIAAGVFLIPMLMAWWAGRQAGNNN